MCHAVAVSKLWGPAGISVFSHILPELLWEGKKNIQLDGEKVDYAPEVVCKVSVVDFCQLNPILQPLKVHTNFLHQSLQFTRDVWYPKHRCWMMEYPLNLSEL